MTDCDIHAVTGMLKLYFRELPEPLFTEANYTNFVESLREYCSSVHVTDPVGTLG